MRHTVYDVADAAAVYAAQSNADKLDLSVFQLAHEGYRVLTGGVVTAQGSPNLTVALSAGADLNNGREIWYGAQNSSAVTAPAAGNDKWILVEVDAQGVLKIDNTTTGPTSGTTAMPVPTAGRTVHALIYISASTITDIDGTNTAGHGKIQDRSVLMPAMPTGSEKLQRWIEAYDDFWSQSGATSAVGALGWNLVLTGAGAAIGGLALGETEPSCTSFSTGTTTTGVALVHLGSGQVQGATRDFVYEWRLRPTVLSTSTQEFEILVGVETNITDGTTEPSDGFYFKYDRVNTGANWQCVVANNGTRTTVDSGVAVATTHQRLKCWFDATNGKAHFLIGDVEVAAITTNIPSARLNTIAASIAKKAGTTARIMSIDYFYLALAVSRT